MTEVRFYHLTRQRLEEALPLLLEKSLERGWRAVVMTGSAERAEQLTQHLWTWRERSFLPHGNARDGQAPDQPVWLTEQDENPNGARVLFLTDGAATERAGSYERVCELFDGNDPDGLARARDRWRLYRTQGHDLSYWQQGPDGRWEQRQVGG